MNLKKYCFTDDYIYNLLYNKDHMQYGGIREVINVLEYLEEAQESFGDKIAIVEGDNSITYAELMHKSKVLGTALARDIDSIGEPVAVCMDKGIVAMICFMGIVYSGNFYSMANPDLPDDRLRGQDKVLCPVRVLTDKKGYDRVCSIYGKDRVIDVSSCIDREEAYIDAALLANIRIMMTDVAPLYANFTSGSTGVPKAVLVAHRSVIDFIDYFTEIFGINDTDIIANQAPFDFDVSVKDIYSAMKKGATLVIVPKEYFSSPAKLVDLLCDKKITTMIWAVSALCLVTTFHGLDYRVPDTIDKILFSGEAMPIKHLKEWMKHIPQAMYVNLYGPTEITCNCTYHIIDKDRVYEGSIPIGKAFPNEEILLLDGENRLIKEAGKVGEICVKGTALALGYYNCPEQTEKVFCQNPLNTHYKELIYRTGDLAYYNEAKELVFNGRKDFQIKHMGHRIELEELELAIDSIDGVQRSAAAFYEEKSKLYAFYVGDIDKKTLHARLKEKLPVFMIPGIIVRVDEIPLTKNGKTDRKKLLADKLEGRI